MTIDVDFLFSRLPLFYQERDVEQGGRLRALLKVIAEQGAILESDIARLYDNWFIETCDDWLIPYIGDLLGVRGLYSVEGTQAFGQRALVANTLRMRRRKGTVPVLEELAFDTTGWRAHAVEFFQLLETTQHLNHRRLFNVRTPDLRNASLLERIDSAFDRTAHTAEVRSLSAGRYNIPNIGLYLWRLNAYAIQRSTASVEPSHPGLYRFDPLGRDMLLFNRPRTETDIVHLTEPINVPESLSRHELHNELTAIRQALTDHEDPALAYFSGDEGGPVLRIWLDGQELPNEHLIICNLSPLPKDPAPHDWRRPPVNVTVTATKPGLTNLTFPADPARFLVGFDPVLGRIALPAGKTANKVEVAYAYGFPGDIGGGPYDRRSVRQEDEVEEGLLNPADFDTVLRVPADKPTLALALATVNPGKRILVRLDTDASESLAPVLNLPDTHLAIEAVNRRRPVLIGNITLEGNDNTRLTLSGITLDGQLKLQGALREVNLRHCSLTPKMGGVQHTGTGSEFKITLTHCISGPITVKNSITGVTARWCIIDGLAQSAFDLPDTILTLDRCTILGETAAGELLASNSLFTERLTITRKQEGCMRFCFVPLKSLTPKRYRCLPDMVMKDLPKAIAANEAVRVTPSFTSTQFGNSAYGQLAAGTATEILTGAEDGAEIGVWNLLKQAQREANLRQALNEYLRFGLEAGVIFVN